MNLYTAPFQTVSTSPIRALLRDSNAPGMISFAGGVPAREALDQAPLQAAITQVQREQFATALAYGETEGSPALRAALTRLSQQRGLAVAPEELLVTSGSQQALDLLVRATLAPGDAVLVEPASYPGALQSFRLAGAEIIPVASDDDGMDPQALARTLQQLGGRAKLVYTVATFSNPTGATWSLQRRIEAAEAAAAHGALLVEDDAYSELRFHGTTLPPIRAVAPAALAHTVYLSTLSKIVAPGLRIGWIVGPQAVVTRCTMAKQVSDMCAAPLSQAIAAAYLDGQHLPHSLPRMTALYRERAQCMSACLRDRLGERVAFAEPAGGMFLWLTLASDIDAREVFKAAAKEQVLFVPGTAFGNEALRHCLRLSFSCTAPSDIPTGIARLERALQAVRQG